MNFFFGTPARTIANSVIKISNSSHLQSNGDVGFGLITHGGTYPA